MSQFAKDIGFPQQTLSDARSPPGANRGARTDLTGFGEVVTITKYAQDIGHNQQTLGRLALEACGPPTKGGDKSNPNSDCYTLKQFSEDIGFPQQTLSDYRKVAHQWAAKNPPTKVLRLRTYGQGAVCREVRGP